MVISRAPCPPLQIDTVAIHCRRPGANAHAWFRRMLLLLAVCHVGAYCNSVKRCATRPGRRARTPHAALTFTHCSPVLGARTAQHPGVGCRGRFRALPCALSIALEGTKSAAPRRHAPQVCPLRHTQACLRLRQSLSCVWPLNTHLHRSLVQALRAVAANWYVVNRVVARAGLLRCRHDAGKTAAEAFIVVTQYTVPVT